MPGLSKAGDVRADRGSKMRGLHRIFRPPVIRRFPKTLAMTGFESLIAFSLQRQHLFQKYHTQRRASASHDENSETSEAVAKTQNFATKLGSHF